MNTRHDRSIFIRTFLAVITSALLLGARRPALAQLFFPNSTTINYDITTAAGTIIGYPNDQDFRAGTHGTNPVIGITAAAAIDGGLTVCNGSTVNFAGSACTYCSPSDDGTADILNCNDSSTLNFTGSADAVNCNDSSTVNISGGCVAEAGGEYFDWDLSQPYFYVRAVTCSGTSALAVSGGEIGGCVAFNSSRTITVTGGAIDGILCVSQGTANIFGGTIGGLQTGGQSTVNVYGGTMYFTLSSHNPNADSVFLTTLFNVTIGGSSTLNIYGVTGWSTTNTTGFCVSDSASVNIYGNPGHWAYVRRGLGLVRIWVPAHTVTYSSITQDASGDTIYVLSGNLSDGSDVTGVTVCVQQNGALNLYY